MQSTLRYYYSDPLAAAWMAKNFGMKLYTVRADGSPFVRLPSALTIARHAGEDCKYKKYCIHPDSLHLLEPIEGDVGYFETSRDWRNEVDKTCAFYHKDGDHDNKPYWEYADGEYGISESNNTKLRIILRNNIPFHWPEKEDA